MKSAFLPEKELAAQDGSEWKFGAMAKDLYAIPHGERHKYLPIGEVQGSDKDDVQDCATRSIVNGWETKFTYAYRNNLITAENRKWLEDNGYVVLLNGLAYVVLADAFNAIKSGTTREGNSLKAPLDSTRKDGMIPKALMPLEKWMTWEEYHNPERITKQIEKLANEFADRFILAYEQVRNSQFSEGLKQGMLDVALYAWPDPINGVYPPVPHQPNHAVLIPDGHFDAFDNYIPFNKKLDPAYRFFEWGYRFAITGERSGAQIVQTYNLFSVLLQKLTALLNLLLASKPSPEPVKPPQETPKPQSRIVQWALGIQAAEGGKPTSLNMRLNNPGAMKYTTYTASLGAKKGPAGSDGGFFAKFDTYNEGHVALQHFLIDACNSRLKSYKGHMTLFDFTAIYAGHGDKTSPNLKNYVKVVCDATGATPSTPIKDLL